MHENPCLIPSYSKTCVKRPLSKRPKIVFQEQLLLNAGQKYCRMLQGEHSAILSTFIKLPFVIKIYVLSIFEWPFYTGLNFYQKLVFKTNYCLMQVKSIFAILSILIKLPFVFKILDLSIFEWPFYTGLNYCT